jgi:hypothetical protein
MVADLPDTAKKYGENVVSVSVAFPIDHRGIPCQPDKSMSPWVGNFKIVKDMRLCFQTKTKTKNKKFRLVPAIVYIREKVSIFTSSYLVCFWRTSKIDLVKFSNLVY